MGVESHRSSATDIPVRCAVLTISDTRTESNDTSGGTIRSRLADAGFQVTAYRIIPDEPERIAAMLDEMADRAEAILINGGTGISRRDGTFDVVSSRMEKELPGFGEIFRALSFEEIGAAAMLSRAIAGVYRNTLVFSMPGSTGAVRLAMERLILPELRHMVWEVLR
jgi:molybdenum cofactor biosynthesis protein B